jgi:hypothetical protein
MVDMILNGQLFAGRRQKGGLVSKHTPKPSSSMSDSFGA